MHQIGSFPAGRVGAHHHNTPENQNTHYDPNYLSHFRIIELPVFTSQAAQSKLTFPDQPDLRYARIQSLEIYTNVDLTVTQPNNYTVITPAQMIQSTVVLECNDADIHEKDEQSIPGRFNSTQQNFQYIPLSALHLIQDSVGTPFVRQRIIFPDTYVTWQKSYMQLNSSGLGNGSTVAFAIGVWYSWRTVDGRPIPRT